MTSSFTFDNCAGDRRQEAMTPGVCPAAESVRLEDSQIKPEPLLLQLQGEA